jgi:site-specific recombinase XerD
MPKIIRAVAIKSHQFKRLIQITAATSRHFQRDILVLMLGHHAALRITETSRITIADVMYASGKLRREISLREAVTKGSKQRCAYLSSKPLIEALEAYLAHRLDRGIGTELNDTAYRGFYPHSPLIFSGRGSGMSQNTKRRTATSGEVVDYRACDSLQAHVTKLYAKAGIKGGSSHSGRRSFAVKILDRTGDMAIVAQLLGHDDIGVSARYVDLQPRILCEMFENAV